MIAILEDDPARSAAMESALQRRLPDAETIFFDNAPDMVAWLPSNLPTVCLLSLDHDLGPNRQRDGEVFDPGIGRDVVALLERTAPTCRVLIHSSNGPAAEGMFHALEFSGWSAERVYPFGDLAWVDTEWIDRVVLCVSPQSLTTIEWPNPWRLVNDRWRQYIGGELAWELSNFPDHLLANRSFQVVAMSDPYDNAIIQFDDSSFGYVKLTWGLKSPHFAPIGGEEQLVRWLPAEAAADRSPRDDPSDRQMCPACGRILQSRLFDSCQYCAEPLPERLRLSEAEKEHLKDALRNRVEDEQLRLRQKAKGKRASYGDIDVDLSHLGGDDTS